MENCKSKNIIVRGTLIWITLAHQTKHQQQGLSQYDFAQV